MHEEGIHIFDQSVQTGNIWLKEIMRELHTENPNEAYAALRAVLHALRDRLPAKESMHLGAQLPVLISGIYFDGYRLTEKPDKMDREEFLERIRDGMRQFPKVDPVRMASAVLSVVSNHISEGEVRDIQTSLPHDLRELFASAGVTERPGY